MSKKRLCWVIALLAFAMLSGNNASTRAEETAAVSGQITLDGKPLAGGRITFYQDDGQFLGARIDKDLGKFKMDRVAAGRYKVTIESKGVPGKYSSEEQSGLVVEVKSGNNVFDFALVSN